MKIGTLVLIGDTQHIIVDKFCVGFQMLDSDLQKEYYYETISMGNGSNKRRSAIARTDFETGMAEGEIRILSTA
tara:strand:+ start:40 stop:261 length:222 start_codon:yes stop_codon:yes gene_type:complete